MQGTRLQFPHSCATRFLASPPPRLASRPHRILQTEGTSPRKTKIQSLYGHLTKSSTCMCRQPMALLFDERLQAIRYLWASRLILLRSNALCGCTSFAPIPCIAFNRSLTATGSKQSLRPGKGVIPAFLQNFRNAPVVPSYRRAEASSRPLSNVTGALIAFARDSVCRDKADAR